LERERIEEWLAQAAESESDSEPEAAGSGASAINSSGSGGALPSLTSRLSRPLTPHEAERLAYLDRLKFFLDTAPSRWDVPGAEGEEEGEGESCSPLFLVFWGAGSTHLYLLAS
jgi:hypothetical protein